MSLPVPTENRFGSAQVLRKWTFACMSSKGSQRREGIGQRGEGKWDNGTKACMTRAKGRRHKTKEKVKIAKAKGGMHIAAVAVAIAKGRLRSQVTKMAVTVRKAKGRWEAS